MVDISPFQGLRYNPVKVPSYTAVTAPPYDVISPAEQQELYRQDPHNIVRLILGHKQSTDNDSENMYTRAHQTLESWREQGIVKAEEQPAVYAYTQAWDGMERRGFIARLRLETYESGQVLPHEYTLGGPKADRLALMKTTGSVLSPIFCLYHDPAKKIEQRLFETTPPVAPIEVRDKDGVLHRFWPITNEADIQAIQGVLKDKAALIADGHHRYETALAYRDWRRAQEGQENAPFGTFPWDYTMAFFTNMADEGLKIYPTHRVFTSYPPGWSKETLLDALNAHFEPASGEAALFYVETSENPPQGYRLKSTMDISAIPEPLRTLDVAILDHVVFQGILKHPANELKQEGYLHFIRDEEEISDLLNEKGTLVFRVHAPSVEQTRQICEAGYRMPQKSTYFYPKLLSGLVLYYYGPQTSISTAHAFQTEGAGLPSA